MSELKSGVQKTFHQIKSRISHLATGDADEFKRIAIEVDPELHRLIRQAAKYEQISEADVIQRALEHYFDTRSMTAQAKISHLQLERNPLLQLNGLTKLIQ